MSGHSHNSSRSVSRQYIIGCPNGNFVTGKRIDTICSCKFTGNFIYIGNSFAFGASFYPLNIFFNFLFLFRYNNLLQKFVFRCQNHKCSTIKCIGACSKHLNNIVVPFYVKVYRCTFTATNPVTLHFFKRVAPINIIKPVE